MLVTACFTCITRDAIAWLNIESIECLPSLVLVTKPERWPRLFPAVQVRMVFRRWFPSVLAEK